ncbi:MAG: archaemetzincin family Zn-dependent metalloprotease [Thermoanaerobaculia bacterium]|nr:archaemetzincin family Zn-dependent metalloprotease [Thermoanaerobaculia bacterium]
MIEPLAREITGLLGLDVVRRPPSFDPEEAYDPARGQYDTRALLSRLISQQLEGGKILGVTDVDLFVPVLTFVFGEAQLGGRAAVVSSHRLAPERYGLPADRNVLEQRLFKEAIHELGHTYELVHCSDSRCVMASSPAVEEIDLKTPRFCSDCRNILGPALSE